MSTTTINYSTSGENIHVKLQFNSEYRRFLIQRSCKFSELADKIKVILGLKDLNFVVKYKDEEGEWITISSDMELDTGLLLSNGTLFRLHITIPGVKNEVETTTETNDKECDGKEFDKPWRGKGKWKKWHGYDEDEENDEKPRKIRGRRGCRGGRGKWRRWRNERNEENNEEEGEDDGTGEEGDEKKNWRRFKNKKRCRKVFDDAESSSENSGDALLNLEEIKKTLEKLKQDMALLKEKSGSAKTELKDLRMKLKEKRRNETTDIDGLVALKNSVKEKKMAWLTIFKEVKSTRCRIKKLNDLAAQKVSN